MLQSGGLNTSRYPCPFASQLAFVWDISAWLTPERSVRGCCLCSDFSDEAPEDRGHKEEEFCWDHLLLRQFFCTLFPLRLLTLWTHTRVERHKRINEHIWWSSNCWSAPQLPSSLNYSFIGDRPNDWKCLLREVAMGEQFENVSLALMWLF